MIISVYFITMLEEAKRVFRFHDCIGKEPIFSDQVKDPKQFVCKNKYAI